MDIIHEMQQELQHLEEHSNLRRLPKMVHDGRHVIVNGARMLNLSSNDYLGLASDRSLREEFLRTLTPDTFLPASSSSRLLTGNFTVYEELEAGAGAPFRYGSRIDFQQRVSCQYGYPACRKRCADADTCRQARPRQSD